MLGETEDYLPHPDLSEEAAQVARPHLHLQTGPGKGDFFAITLEGVAALAAFWNQSPRKTMITLLESGVWPLRFAKNRGVFSAEDQAKLLRSGAAVIGCGGLGGHVATLLARLGVGFLSLCDHDVFDESNLNRQLLAKETNLGKNKAVVLADDIQQIASHVALRVHPLFADPDNLPEILGGVDVVIDCLDSLVTRRQVEATAHALEIPFIHGSVAGEEGFAMRTQRGGKGLSAILGDTPHNEPGAERTLGVPTLTPAAIAILEAHLAVRAILGESASNEVLWHLDLSAMQLTPIVM